MNATFLIFGAVFTHDALEATLVCFGDSIPNDFKYNAFKSEASFYFRGFETSASLFYSCLSGYCFVVCCSPMKKAQY